MIEVTVKTLDSQNHPFSLEDDQITVRGFKEHIAESISVAADSQRLIYHGRVLQDDKKLNDYDVNGKVIHLVQREPPQPGQRNNDTPQNQRQGPEMIWRSWQSRQPNFEHMQGNAMYVGAMSMPTEVMMEGTGPAFFRLHENRLRYNINRNNTPLSTAHHMLNQINELLNKLDDPNAPLHPPTPEPNAPPTVGAQVHIQEIDPDTDDTRFARAASAAIVAAFSAAGLNNVTLLQGNTDENGGVTVASTQDDNASETRPEQPPREEEDQPQASDSAETTSEQRPTEGRNPRSREMYELLRKLDNTQTRLQPYIKLYRNLMQQDPPLPSYSGTQEVEANQKIVDGVGESLHYMSHALHAISDLHVDMRQPPPRLVTNRSRHARQSAILQAGIPIQVEAHISLNGRHPNNNNSNEETNGTTNAQPSSNTTESANSGTQGTTGPESQNTRSRAQPQQETPFGPFFNLPNDVEVLMEMSPESSRRDTLRGENLIRESTGSAPRNDESSTQESTNNNNNPPRGMLGPIGDVISWTASSAEVIRSVMQAATGQILQGNIPASIITASLNPSASGPQTVAVSMDSTSTNPGQSTQARSNVDTHPTTATHTRSTSRPHIFHQHIQPEPFNVNLPMSSGMIFDRLLPCHSRHIHTNPPVSTTTTSTTQQTRPTAETASEAPAQATAQTQAQSSTSTSSEDPTATSTTAEPTSSQVDATIQTCLNVYRRISRTARIQQLFNGVDSEESEIEEDLRAEQRPEDLSRARDSTLVDLMGLGDILSAFIASEEFEREDSFLVNLLAVLMQNTSLERAVRLRFGQLEPITYLRSPLREFLEHTFSTATSPQEIQEQTMERFLSQLRPFYEDSFDSEQTNPERPGRIVDVGATIESILGQQIKKILMLLFDNGVDDSLFAELTISIFRYTVEQLCVALRYSVVGGQSSLESVVIRNLISICSNVNPPVSPSMLHLMVGVIFSTLRTYLDSIPQPPEAEIIPHLIYKNAPPSGETPERSPDNLRTYLDSIPRSSEAEIIPHLLCKNATSSQETPVRSTTEQPRQQQSPVEMMEVEIAETKPTNNTLENEDEDEEIPQTFPGHEVLPSDWVPIIARDGLRQRRQLQMQEMVNGGTTTFSDAYLGGLPNKRRKLIEQQKPHLLVGSNSNHAAITASMERLVRDSIGRAGVEEVEGSVLAVSTEPNVRHAFGQAIRDCLDPNRYGTPDFPNALRFPNATKYFADKKKPSK